MNLKLLDAQQVEIKVRKNGETINVNIDECSAKVKDMLQNL